LIGQNGRPAAKSDGAADTPEQPGAFVCEAIAKWTAVVQQPRIKRE